MWGGFLKKWIILVAYSTLCFSFWMLLSFIAMNVFNTDEKTAALGTGTGLLIFNFLSKHMRITLEKK
jgi:hypothetical protein